MSRLLAGRDLVQELRLAGKMTLAGTLAWWISSELGAHRPIFATLVPLVAMTGDPFSAVSVSVDRIVGVFAGVGIGIALVHLSLSPTLVIAIGLLLGTTVGIVLRVGSRANVQPAVSILFMLGVAGSSQVGVARVWETSVGAAITVVVSALLWPPTRRASSATGWRASGRSSRPISWRLRKTWRPAMVPRGSSWPCCASTRSTRSATCSSSTTPGARSAGAPSAVATCPRSRS